MGEAPQISVVAATHDRPVRLSRLIASLRSQTLDTDSFEVVIVDDGSRAETAAVLENERRMGGLSLKTLRLAEAGGPARARNFGWRSATGEIIAFTDDDCAADPRWLESMLASARENPRAIVQGRTEPAPDEIEARGVFSRTLEVTELGPFFQTCNVAYPRVLLEELGGFDEEAFPQHPGGEDTDLALRAIARGTPAVFADEARVFHAVNELGAIGGLRLALRWSDSMAIFGRHPAIRERLHRGVFWKESHELLLRALIGIALARKLRPAVLLAFPLAFPYAKDVALRTIRSGSPVALAPYVAVQDLLEVYATVRGAIKNRVLVL